MKIRVVNYCAAQTLSYVLTDFLYIYHITLGADYLFKV